MLICTFPYYVLIIRYANIETKIATLAQGRRLAAKIHLDCYRVDFDFEGLNGTLLREKRNPLHVFFVFPLQTDYDRHFEELMERAETCLVEILQRNLNNENLDQVIHYHDLLENVRRLSKGTVFVHTNFQAYDTSTRREII